MFLRFVISILLLMVFGSPNSSSAAPNDKLMAPWSLSDVTAALGRDEPFHPFPTYQQREFWDKVKQNERFTESLNEVIERAREFDINEFPNLPASLYFDFQRTGNRTRYQRVLGERDAWLSTLALAECLEGKGEFIDPLVDVIWAFCEESDWCLPAHTDGLVNMENPPIDLRSSRVGCLLAEIDNVYGDALPERVRQRIDYELERRIFEPYLTRDDFFWLTRTHNWNAVCNGNILRTALYEGLNQNRLAKIIVKAQNAMCRYLTGFGQDGGTAEGLGYWNYGFSRYVYATHLLNVFTDKRLNMFTPPIVKEIAQFPMRTELSPYHYPSFSDGGEHHHFSSSLLYYLAQELELQNLSHFATARMDESANVGSLHALYQDAFIAPLPTTSAEFTPEAFVYLGGVEWMIVRNPDGLVLAAKGGRNDEPHNHNDVGNFIVHYQGESLIVDLGAPVYDRDFFSGKRYTYLAARSSGHSVPLVNGHEQRSGRDAVAQTVVTRRGDNAAMRVDMTSAYPSEAGLKLLIRETSFQQKGQIELHDQVKFNQEPKAFETALWTYGKVETIDKGVIIQGEAGSLKVTHNHGNLTVDVKEYETKEHKLRTASAYPVAQRIGFVLKNPQKEDRIRLTIVPFKEE